MVNNTNTIKDTIYPLVEKSLSGNGTRNFMKLVSDFINDRSEALFSILPVSRIPYSAKDRDELFKALNISPKVVQDAINNTYYGDIKKFNFKAPQDPSTVLITCIIKYFISKHDIKKTELASIYLAFSGKYYPSIHYTSFRIPPVEYVMEYVVHNIMDNKFDIVNKGNIFNAIKSKCDTWVKTYINRFKSFSDEDVVYIILQLKSRLKSFMINIAKLYYKAYENKEYLVYNSDNIDPNSGDNYHLANSDSFVANKSIDKAITYITSSGIDYRTCKLSSNKTVKTDELKSIMEAIMNSSDRLQEVKNIITNLVYSYFATSKEKSVLSMSFVAFCVTSKPNTKDPHLIYVRDTIINWLDTESVLFRKRKNRDESRNNYIRAVLMYIALSIYTANKK
jgi:hypothetical protein